ncbi:E3 ubiquitin-protein ligase SINA-like 10 [Platanthera zijinensis]|uniref:RING-type E3 ubiquitin transferase n=1 Tax=Platanthera zijinensis TaxID=2320716 RepID=A0AAP0B4N3_9ASPA
MGRLPAAQRKKGPVSNGEAVKVDKYPGKITRKRIAVNEIEDKEAENRAVTNDDDGEFSGDVQEVRGRNAWTLQLDPALLDCPICFEPLTSPIFQCLNGHFACSLCTKKLDGGKCPSCSLQIGDIRNLGLEFVAAGARVRCPFSAFGCQDVVSYTNLLAHEAACPRAPCSCPISGCGFNCSASDLAAHIRNKHHPAAGVHEFTYGRPLRLLLRPEEPFMVLLGDDDSPVFLLARSNGGHNMPSGSVQMIVICLRPTSSSWKWDYEYKAAVSCNRTALQLTTRAVSTTLWSGDFGMNVFLFVPHGSQNVLEEKSSFP